MNRSTCRSSVPCLLSILTLILTLSLPPAPLCAQAPAPEAAPPPKAAPETATPPKRTPAEETFRKLATTGIIDGTDWSISLDLKETALANVLDFLAEAARTKPREINITLDRLGIAAAGISLDTPVTLKLKHVSLQEALDKVLGKDLGYVIDESGRVTVTAKAGIPAMLQRWKAFPMLVRPTAAAAEALKRLDAGGMVDGAEWSITLNCKATALVNVLDFVAGTARAKPRQISVAIDKAAIENAGINLEDPIDLDVKDVSLGEALRMVLAAAPDMAVAILDDGSVLITSQSAVRAMATKAKPVSVADSPKAAATVATLGRSGTVDGVNYGLTTALTGETVWQTLTTTAARLGGRSKDPVTFHLERPAGSAAQAILDRKVSLHARDWSPAEVLAAVLPPEFGYAIEADGSVRIVQRPKPAETAPSTGIWTVPEKTETLP